eukprot:Opistho-1_new@100704
MVCAAGRFTMARWALGLLLGALVLVAAHAAEVPSTDAKLRSAVSNVVAESLRERRGITDLPDDIRKWIQGAIEDTIVGILTKINIKDIELAISRMSLPPIGLGIEAPTGINASLEIASNTTEIDVNLLSDFQHLDVVLQSTHMPMDVSLNGASMPMNVSLQGRSMPMDVLIDSNETPMDIRIQSDQLPLNVALNAHDLPMNIEMTTQEMPLTVKMDKFSIGAVSWIMLGILLGAQLVLAYFLYAQQRRIKAMTKLLHSIETDGERTYCTTCGTRNCSSSGYCCYCGRRMVKKILSSRISSANGSYHAINCPPESAT